MMMHIKSPHAISKNSPGVKHSLTARDILEFARGLLHLIQEDLDLRTGGRIDDIG